MTSPTASQDLPQDNRPWTAALRGLGPLAYLPKDRSAHGEVEGEFNYIGVLNDSVMVLGAGARAGRGLGSFAAILVAATSVLLALLALKMERDPTFFWNGLGMATLCALAALAFASFDFFRIAETLVLIDRKNRRIVAADSTAPKVKRAKDIRFAAWPWDACDFAIERVVFTATGAQTFHLRAVIRDAQGLPVKTVLLVALIPTIPNAEAIFETLRRFMAGDDAGLPRRVRLIPMGRFDFFQACKYSFITHLVEVGPDGLPRWPTPLVLLFYAALAAGLVMAFPFVLAKVLAEWSSQEMRFPAKVVPKNMRRIPGIELVPPGNAVFAPFEKAYYLGCMIVGAGAWVWLAWQALLIFNEIKL